MEPYEKNCDVMMVKLQSGEIICVIAPYGKGEESGAVITTTGQIGKIVKRVCDYTGEILPMMDMIVPVHVARRVMRTTWDEKEGRDNA